MGSRGQNNNYSSQNRTKRKQEKVKEHKPNPTDSLDDLDEMEMEDFGEESNPDENRGQPQQALDKFDIRNFDRDNLPFEVLDQGDFRKTYRYELLDQLGRRWRIVTRDNPREAFKQSDMPDGLDFDLARPTCYWVKDGKAVQLFVEGMNRKEFFEALNLEYGKLDNTTTLSKRMSRILRPQSITGYVPAESVKISHELPQLDGVDAKTVWDGGGVVSRQMLLRMIGQLPKDLDESSRHKLINELRKSQRVEFTVMTPEGQLKGHASVMETNDALWQQIENRTKKFAPNVTEISDELRQDFYEAADMLAGVARENRNLKKQGRKNERRNLNLETEELLSRLSQKHSEAFNEQYGNGSYGQHLDLELEVALRHAAGLKMSEDLLRKLEKTNKMENLDDLKPTDFLIPEDYKKHIKMTGDDYFIAFKAAKGSGQMHLDIQSNINLGKFWSVEQKQQWLREEGQVFLHAIESGDMGPALTRIDPTISPEKLENWPLVEYGSGGGDPNWSDSIVRQLSNQHLRSLEQMKIQKPTLGEDNKLIRPEDKLSLPIPGGRYYVFPAPIARAAGKNIHVAPNEAYVDKASGTVWVNEDDWIRMKDAAPDREDDSGVKKPWGLARILGGMDNDDALWVQEFLDESEPDAQQPKLLIWRSPNAPGEYAVLNSHKDSNPIPWTRVNEDGKLEEVRYTHANTQNLFPRIDHALEKGYIKIETDNISKVEPNDIATARKITGDEFLDSMYEAAVRAEANKRTVGSYCNLMMIEVASRDISPENPLILPCTTEGAIDAAQKTGADTSKALEFIDNRRIELLDNHVPVPKRLHQRLQFKNKIATPTNGTDALTQTDNMVLQHIREFTAARDNLMGKARPPHAVIQHGISDADAFEIGKKLNSTWEKKRKEKTKIADKQRRRLNDAEWAEINGEVIKLLDEHAGNPQKQGRILAGAWTSAFLNNNSDSAIWALGPKTQDGTNTQGTFHMTVKMLQELGLTDIPDWKEEEGLRYLPNPEPVTYKDGHRRDYRPIHIQGAGLNLMDNLAIDYLNQAQSPEFIQEHGLQAAKKQLAEQGNRDIYRALPKPYFNIVKDRATKMLQSRLRETTSGEKSIYINLKETVDKEGVPRLDVITESGFRLGLISKETQHHYQAGESIEVRTGIENDLIVFGTAYKANKDAPTNQSEQIPED